MEGIGGLKSQWKFNNSQHSKGVFLIWHTEGHPSAAKFTLVCKKQIIGTSKAFKRQFKPQLVVLLLVLVLVW
ncbi:hypothetical protein VNO78_31739 [Psophocarpus tetragonolobus]|uniref:Uncharacterized protein n=1 Tax=Psophocarpus tetragonolobus TaxID=3891 RepID=A0AAN9RYU2_PSOTE